MLAGAFLAALFPAQPAVSEKVRTLRIFGGGVPFEERFVELRIRPDGITTVRVTGRGLAGDARVVPASDRHDLDQLEQAALSPDGHRPIHPQPPYRFSGCHGIGFEFVGTSGRSGGISPCVGTETKAQAYVNAIMRIAIDAGSPCLQSAFVDLPVYLKDLADFSQCYRAP